MVIKDPYLRKFFTFDHKGKNLRISRQSKLFLKEKALEWCLNSHLLCWTLEGVVPTIY